MLNLIASLEAVPIYNGPAGPPSSSPTTSFIISNNIFYSNKEMFLRQDRIRQDRGTAKITVRKSLITTSTRPGTSEWSGPQASGLQQEQRPHHLRVPSLPSLHRSSRRPWATNTKVWSRADGCNGHGPARKLVDYLEHQAFVLRPNIVPSFS